MRDWKGLAQNSWCNNLPVCKQVPVTCTQLWTDDLLWFTELWVRIEVTMSLQKILLVGRGTPGGLVLQRQREGCTHIPDVECPK